MSFSFAALDFVAPRKINYYYQLYPYDKNWIEAGNRTYAAYTNIPRANIPFVLKPGARPQAVKCRSHPFHRDYASFLENMVVPGSVGGCPGRPTLFSLPIPY
ncbi:triple tyrosine motif-containing protein [Paraflavitalea speifideaquila]|uniref:triple tyrosine motif-containing protein n=1 Tax=Paraflavitalea speifideaquila TaxID=3076558 RepID=UPI003312F9BA